MNISDPHTNHEAPGHDRANVFLAARVDGLLQDGTEVRDQARFWLSDAYHVLDPDDESYRRALDTARSVDALTDALDNVVGDLGLDAYTPEHRDMERGDDDPLLTETDDGWLPTKVRTEHGSDYDPYDLTWDAEALGKDLDRISNGLAAVQVDLPVKHDPDVLDDAIMLCDDASHGFKTLQAHTADGVAAPNGLGRDPFDPGPPHQVSESVAAAENGLDRIREQHAAGLSGLDDDVARWHANDMQAEAERSRGHAPAIGPDQEPPF